MRIRFTLFAGLLPLVTMLSACSSAGKCKRGEIGCACTLEGTCGPTARCDTHGMCLERSAGGGTGGDGSGGTGGKTDAGSKTDAGKTDAGKTDAGRKTDAGGGRPDAGVIDCPSTSFDAACRAFCQAFCQNQQLLCVSSACTPGECEPGGMLYKVCAMTCDADTSCVQSLCMGEGQRTCEEFGFLDTATNVYQAGCFEDDPQCVINPDFGCSDTCGSLANNTGGDLAQNGMCEDGGKNSTSSSCPRGTDCTDCKPRTCAKALGTCANNGDCCGYYAHKSLCVDTGSGGQCLATCDDTTCPGTQSCRSAQDKNGAVFHVCAP
jgi:hypothetical protein